MLTGRSLHVVAPLTWERNESPPASAVYVEVMRKGLRDVGVVAGPLSLNLTTANPALYPGLLAGALTQQVSSGLALFNGLSVNVPGPYTLHASCENDLLQETATSPTTGSMALWHIYNVPTGANPNHMGRWVNFTGPGVSLGIWAKIVDVGHDATLGDYWVVEQPPGTTSLATLLSYSGLVTVKYNAVNPLLPPPNYLVVAIDAWFAWNPTTGTYLGSFSLEESNEVLTVQLDFEVLRHVTIAITSFPSAAKAGYTYGLLAVIQNQDGGVATDLNGTVLLEVRSASNALVYSATPAVVNGNIFTPLTMPLLAGSYTIWVKYQGTWYQAAQVSDSRAVAVSVAPPPEDPGTPPPPDAKFPEKVFGLSTGCPLDLVKTTVLELDAPDTFIEVLVK